MSFPKAELKRFNETAGCAPPVGAYDPKDGKKATNVIIEKTDRFKQPKDVGNSLGSDFLLSPSTSFIQSSTPIKDKNKSANVSSGSETSILSTSSRTSTKKPAQFSEHLARVRELEMEIRRLLRDKSDKDKELQRLHRDHERLEGRLNGANADRATGLARAAQLEQETRDAKRSLEVLQKQVSTTETAGKRKGDKLKEEVQSLQQQIHSKEREIQSTQKQIVQALLALAADTEECVRRSDGLSDLFHRLEMSMDMSESEEEDRQVTPASSSGCKEIDSQIKKVRRMIKRVSSSVTKLAECGVDKVDGLHSRLAAEHSCRLNEVSCQLADTQLQHHQLQQQLTLQQQQHEQRLCELMQQRQQECESMQLKIEKLQQDCDEAQHHLTQTQQEYTTAQACLQQTQEQHQSLQSQMQRDRDTLESQLQEERDLLESRLTQEQATLRQEQESQACVVREREDLRMKLELEHAQVEELRLKCQQAEEEQRLSVERLEEVHEHLKTKEDRLAELEDKVIKQQAEHNAASQDLQEKLAEMEERLRQAEGELQQKQGQQEEALQQLQQAQTDRESVQGQLQHSQESRIAMQQQIHSLREEVDKLKELVDHLQDNRDCLEEESDRLNMANKELEFKGCLLSDAVQSLEGDVYAKRETGTPVKAKQLLFEETAERAVLEERIQHLHEKEKVLNANIEALTAKYQDMIHQLELDLTAEKDKGCQMEEKCALSEKECQTISDELEKIKLVNQDLMQNLNIFQNEVTCLKSSEEDMQKEREDLTTANTELQASVQGLHLKLEEEQQAACVAHTRAAQLEDDCQAAHVSQQQAESLAEQLEKDRQAACSVQQQAQAQAQQLEVERLAACTAHQQAHSRAEQLHQQAQGLAELLDQERRARCAAKQQAQAQVEELEVQNRQHDIANQALQGKLHQLTESFTQETSQLKDKCDSLTQEKQGLVEKHKEDLHNVRKALALDRQTNDVQLTELNLKLERAQTFNAQMKEELKKLLRDKEKLKDDSRTETAALQMKVETAVIQATEASSQCELLRHQLTHSKEDVARWNETVVQLEHSLASKEEEGARLQSVLQGCQSQLAEQEEKLSELQAEKDALEDYVNSVSVEHSQLEAEMEKQLRSVQDAALEERTQLEQIISEMSEKIEQLEEMAQPEDTEEWRQKYEDLYARVEPFMEQLDAFAAERNLLLGRSQMAELEVGKMMDKYAKLLGHQNQKQKIQYINKLKEEYMQCRKEKEDLKEKSNKQQNTIQKLEKRLQSLEGRKTFDPSQAFKQGSKKEDGLKSVSKRVDPVQVCKQAARRDDLPRSPLKQSNK